MYAQFQYDSSQLLLKPVLLTNPLDSALKPEQLNALNENQLKAMPPTLVKALQADQLSALPPKQLNAFNPEQWQALSASQLAALTPTQISGLKPQGEWPSPITSPAP